MRKLRLGFMLAVVLVLSACASHRQVLASPNISGRPPALGTCVPNCAVEVCPAFAAGYSSCNPILGPAAINGEDADLGYDINAATGNLFLAQPDIHVHPGLGPDLDFVRFYNSQGNGVDIGIGPNWTHSFSWSIKFGGIGAKDAAIVADTGRVIHFSFTGNSWKPQDGEFGSLNIANPPGQAQSSIYTDKFGTAYSFDSSGRLNTIQPPDNYPINITYSGGTQISSVTSGPACIPRLCLAASIRFSYSGSHISSISDPAGAVWLYGYTPPFIPGLCVPTRFVACPAQLSQSGTGLLQTVTIPNARIPLSSVHGMTLYSYSTQTAGGITVSPTREPALLTGYAVITNAGPWRSGIPQSNVTEAILGLFIYSASTGGQPVMVEAASGVTSQLLRHVKLQYSPQSSGAPKAGDQLITTVFLNGGNKTITSTYVNSTDTRLASITSTAGTGIPGEMQTESWTWNTNLTLDRHSDGNNINTFFGPYDSLGNPMAIVEAIGTPQARTTRITWHPVLSRPLSITQESVSTPNCFTFSIPGCQTHQVIFDYDQPVNHEYSTSWNGAPTNYLYQIVEIGYTGTDLSASLKGGQQSHTVQIARDAIHRITSISGPRTGQLTSYAYSPSSGFLATETRSVTSGKSLITTYSGYDGDGRVTSVIDPNGNVTKTAYDLAGAVLSSGVYSADGVSSSGVTYVRDLAENIIQVTNADGSVVSTELDPALRAWRVSATPVSGTPLAGSSTVWSRVIDYDSFNRPVTVRLFGSGGLGADMGPGCTSGGSEQLCKEFAYDPWERLASIHTLDAFDNVCAGVYENCKTTFGYDGDGNLLSVGNSLDGATTYTMDPLNRVAAIHTASGTATLGYDVNDHVVWRRDPRDAQNGGTGGDRLAIYLYDDFGRVIMVRTPDIGTWTNTYDASGNLSASQDGSGAHLNYTYDFLNRRTGVTSPSPNESVTFVYDEQVSIPGTNTSSMNSQGRLTSILATDLSGNPVVNRFSYDDRGDALLQTDLRSIGQFPNNFPDFVTTTQFAWETNTSKLDSITYPDHLVVTLQCPSVEGSASMLKPSGIAVSFNGATTCLVSNAKYFADGAIQGLQFGNNSTLVVTRNKRGETMAITSGPASTPVVQQSYTYPPNDIGQVTSVTFFPNQPNTWQWLLSYNGIGELKTYSTNVRPTMDSYAWGYDEVGNRTKESCNGQVRSYSYDSAGVTNHLQAASGDHTLAVPQGDPSNLIGRFYATYDSNGATSQVVAMQNFGGAMPNLNGGSQIYYQFQYNSHHHLEEVDQKTSFAPPPPLPPLPLPSGISPYQSLPYQQNIYDGLDRIVQVYCPVPQPVGMGVAVPVPIPAFGICGAAVANNMQTAATVTNNSGAAGPYVVGTPCPKEGTSACDSQGDLLDCSQESRTNTTTVWTLLQKNSPSCGVNNSSSSGNSGMTSPSAVSTWHAFYYGSDGRLLEEFEFNGASTRGPCPAYDVTDHVYLAGMEVARVIRQYQSILGGTDPVSCALFGYKYVDKDILYLHHDARGALVAVESVARKGLAWEAEISPFGQVMHAGLPGPDGKIGTSDDIVFPDPSVITLTSGSSGASVDGQLGGFLDQPGEIDPTAGLSTTPGANVWSGYGYSAYAPTPTVSGPGGIGSGDAGLGSGPFGILASLVVGAEPAPSLETSVYDGLSRQYGQTFTNGFLTSAGLKLFPLLHAESHLTLHEIGHKPSLELVEWLKRILPGAEWAELGLPWLERLSWVGMAHSLLASNTANVGPECISSPCSAYWRSRPDLFGPGPDNNTSPAYSANPLTSTAPVSSPPETEISTVSGDFSPSRTPSASLGIPSLTSDFYNPDKDEWSLEFGPFGYSEFYPSFNPSASFTFQLPAQVCITETCGPNQ